MASTRDDNLTPFDLVEIFGVSLVAALRGGSGEDAHYTARQKKHLDRIKRRADGREDKMRGKNRTGKGR